MPFTAAFSKIADDFVSHATMRLSLATGAGSHVPSSEYFA